MLRSWGHRSQWWREICRWCQRDILVCHLYMVELGRLHEGRGLVKGRMKRKMNRRRKGEMERGKGGGREEGGSKCVCGVEVVRMHEGRG